MREMTPMKYTEHRSSNTKLAKKCTSTKVIRISVTDTSATDSSSDDDGDESTYHRHRVKRYVSEIILKPCSETGKNTAGRKSRKEDGEKRQPLVHGTSKKFRGVRQRTWGKWAAEIRDSSKGIRVWLGTYDTAEEAALAWDEAALRIHGPKAITNFGKPETDVSDSDISNGQCSPSSVFKFQFNDGTKLIKGEFVENGGDYWTGIHGDMEDDNCLNSMCSGEFVDMEMMMPGSFQECFVMPDSIVSECFTDLDDLDLDENWDVDGYFHESTIKR